MTAELHTFEEFDKGFFIAIDPADFKGDFSILAIYHRENGILVMNELVKSRDAKEFEKLCRITKDKYNLK